MRMKLPYQPITNLIPKNQQYNNNNKVKYVIKNQMEIFLIQTVTALPTARLSIVYAK